MQSEGGIRRIYTIVVAGLECILVSSFKVGLLIELEMLIYALSAALFFYSFVYLRIQRQAKFKYVDAGPHAHCEKGGEGGGRERERDRDRERKREREREKERKKKRERVREASRIFMRLLVCL